MRTGSAKAEPVRFDLWGVLFVRRTQPGHINLLVLQGRNPDRRGRQSTENGLPARLIMPPDLTAAFDLSASGCEVRPPSERKKAQEELLPRETAGEPLYPHPEGATV